MQVRVLSRAPKVFAPVAEWKTQPSQTRWPMGRKSSTLFGGTIVTLRSAGGVRLNATVLKAVGPQKGSVGSNPTRSSQSLGDVAEPGLRCPPGKRVGVTPPAGSNPAVSAILVGRGFLVVGVSFCRKICSARRNETPGRLAEPGRKHPSRKRERIKPPQVRILHRPPFV